MILLLLTACDPDVATDTADTSDTSDTADTADTVDSADTGDTGDTSDTNDTSDTADTGDTADTADTAETGDTADTSDTADSGDTADTSDTADTAETGDTADTADTAETGDTADTADTAETGDTADTADTADTVDTADTADTSCPPTTWYPDADGDGFGDDASPLSACDAPEGYLSSGGDCDDSSAAANPYASEACNGLDDNCDGVTDDIAPYFEAGDVLVALESTFAAGTSSSPATWTATGPGTLHLCSGTWYVNLTLPYDVTVVSDLGDRTQAILDGAGGTILNVTGGTTTVESLTLTGADASAIQCTSGTLDLYDVDITGNTAGSGGGLLLYDCDTTLDASVVQGNFAGYGGGLYADLSTVTLTASTFEDNTADEGGGAMLSNGELVCDGSTGDAGFLRNEASYGGSGVDLFLGELTATACDFGLSTDGDDNGPHELNTRGIDSGTPYDESFHPRNDATFSCAVDPGQTCGAPDTTQLNTGTSSYLTLNASGRVGVMLTALTDFTLRGFSWDVDSGGCSPTFSLYEGYTFTGTSITPGTLLSTWSPAATDTSDWLGSAWPYYTGDSWVDIDEGQEYWLELSYSCAGSTSMDAWIDNTPAASSLWSSNGVFFASDAGAYTWYSTYAPVMAQLTHTH